MSNYLLDFEAPLKDLERKLFKTGVNAHKTTGRKSI